LIEGVFPTAQARGWDPAAGSQPSRGGKTSGPSVGNAGNAWRAALWLMVTGRLSCPAW